MTGTPPRNKLARPLAFGMIGLAVFAVGAAIYVTGSPMQQRRERVDERRVDALKDLVREVRAHAKRHDGRLPASIDALTRPGLRLDQRDPVTGTPYEYRVIDAGTFELCASFESDTARNARYRRWDTDWAHGAGRHCFQRRLHETRAQADAKAAAAYDQGP